MNKAPTDSKNVPSRTLTVKSIDVTPVYCVAVLIMQLRAASMLQRRRRGPSGAATSLAIKESGMDYIKGDASTFSMRK
jgi:hypothetical protein